LYFLEGGIRDGRDDQYLDRSHVRHEKAASRRPLEDKGAVPYTRRPSHERIHEIGRRLIAASERVTRSAIASAIQIETGCSRATAYRALRAFLEPKIETRTAGRFLPPSRPPTSPEALRQRG
jgi:hypothetical protein